MSGAETKEINDVAHNRDGLRTFHLFAGAGGGILADLLLGHIPVGACEIEEYPRKVLFARQRDGILPEFPIWDDIRTLDGKPWRGLVDVVCGGFPCQDISAAGKGAGITGERSGLWSEMRRVIGEIRPRYVFVENSPRLAVLGATRVIADLAGMGYVGRNGVLGSCDAGGNCVGKRMWILAEATESRREGLVCGKSRFSKKKSGGRKADDDDTCSRADRIRSLEKMVGEPAILGGRDAVANRVDRLAAIGNGQDPFVAALAWQILSQ